MPRHASCTSLHLKRDYMRLQRQERVFNKLIFYIFWTCFNCIYALIPLCMVFIKVEQLQCVGVRSQGIVLFDLDYWLIKLKISSQPVFSFYKSMCCYFQMINCYHSFQGFLVLIFVQTSGVNMFQIIVAMVKFPSYSFYRSVILLDLICLG